jgi:hypothetical protein
VNFTVRYQAVGIYSGTYEDMHQSKGNMIAEVFDCVKIGTGILVPKKSIRDYVMTVEPHVRRRVVSTCLLS